MSNPSYSEAQSGSYIYFADASRGDPNTTVREHIRLLHDYNEIKDVAENLMSMVAEDRGVLKADVYKDFGVDPNED